MLQAGDGLCLALEAAAVPTESFQVFAQDLDGCLVSMTRMAAQVDDSHGPFTELCLNLVSGEGLANHLADCSARTVGLDPGELVLPSLLGAAATSASGKVLWVMIGLCLAAGLLAS